MDSVSVRKATEGKRREKGRGAANQVLISRCGNFGGNWSTRLRSIPLPPNICELAAKLPDVLQFVPSNVVAPVPAKLHNYLETS